MGSYPGNSRVTLSARRFGVAGFRGLGQSPQAEEGQMETVNLVLGLAKIALKVISDERGRPGLARELQHLEEKYYVAYNQPRKDHRILDLLERDILLLGRRIELAGSGAGTGESKTVLPN